MISLKNLDKNNQSELIGYSTKLIRVGENQFKIELLASDMIETLYYKKAKKPFKQLKYPTLIADNSIERIPFDKMDLSILNPSKYNKFNVKLKKIKDDIKKLEELKAKYQVQTLDKKAAAKAKKIIDKANKKIQKLQKKIKKIEAKMKKTEDKIKGKVKPVLQNAGIDINNVPVITDYTIDKQKKKLIVLPKKIKQIPLKYEPADGLYILSAARNYIDFRDIYIQDLDNVSVPQKPFIYKGVFDKKVFSQLTHMFYELQESPTNDLEYKPIIGKYKGQGYKFKYNDTDIDFTSESFVKRLLHFNKIVLEKDYVIIKVEINKTRKDGTSFTDGDVKAYARAKEKNEGVRFLGYYDNLVDNKQILLFTRLSDEELAFIYSLFYWIDYDILLSLQDLSGTALINSLSTSMLMTSKGKLKNYVINRWIDAISVKEPIELAYHMFIANPRNSLTGITIYKDLLDANMTNNDLVKITNKIDKFLLEAVKDIVLNFEEKQYTPEKIRSNKGSYQGFEDVIELLAKIIENKRIGDAVVDDLYNPDTNITIKMKNLEGKEYLTTLNYIDWFKYTFYPGTTVFDIKRFFDLNKGKVTELYKNQIDLQSQIDQINNSIAEKQVLIDSGTLDNEKVKKLQDEIDKLNSQLNELNEAIEKVKNELNNILSVENVIQTLYIKNPTNKYILHFVYDGKKVKQKYIKGGLYGFSSNTEVVFINYLNIHNNVRLRLPIKDYPNISPQYTDVQTPNRNICTASGLDIDLNSFISESNVFEVSDFIPELKDLKWNLNRIHTDLYAPMCNSIYYQDQTFLAQERQIISSNFSLPYKFVFKLKTTNNDAAYKKGLVLVGGNIKKGKYNNAAWIGFKLTFNSPKGYIKLLPPKLTKGLLYWEKLKNTDERSKKGQKKMKLDKLSKVPRGETKIIYKHNTQGEEYFYGFIAVY